MHNLTWIFENGFGTYDLTWIGSALIGCTIVTFEFQELGTKGFAKDAFFYMDYMHTKMGVHVMSDDCLFIISYLCIKG